MAADVWNIARKSGVKGGTINAPPGNWFGLTTKTFGMEMEPEKELVMILMPSDLINKVVNDLSQRASPGQSREWILL